MLFHCATVAGAGLNKTHITPKNNLNWALKVPFTAFPEAVFLVVSDPSMKEL